MLPQNDPLWLSSGSWFSNASFHMVKWEYFFTSQGTSEAGFIMNLQSVLSVIAPQLNSLSSEILGVLKRTM